LLSDIRLELPNKLNVHAQEFNMQRGMELQNSRFALPITDPNAKLKIFMDFRSSNNIFNSAGNLNSVQQSKSSGNMQQQLQMAQHNRQIMQQIQQQQQQQQQRLLLASGTHPLQMSSGLTLHQSSHMPLVNSPSSGNILHVSFLPQTRLSLNLKTTKTFQQSSPRVKFAPETVIHPSFSQPSNNTNGNNTNGNSVIINNSLLRALPLQRSKSLTSADVVLTRGIAGLGLGLSAEDIGAFPPEVLAVINKASEDPNQLTARCLMELATHCMNRAVEGRR
jgi:hypothetical protein